MTFKEIVAMEDANKGFAYLHLEGTFLKAYNQSAYLVHKHIQPFKLKRKFIKKVNRNVVYLGFPQAALKKYFYNHEVLQPSEKLFAVNFHEQVDEALYNNFDDLASLQQSASDKCTKHTALIENQPVFKTALDNLLTVMDIASNIDTRFAYYRTKINELAFNLTYSILIYYDVENQQAHAEKTIFLCRELGFALQVLFEKRQLSDKNYSLCCERLESVRSQVWKLSRKATA